MFPIVLPPLRQRADDLPRLATHFLEQAAQRYGRRGRPQGTIVARGRLGERHTPGVENLEAPEMAKDPRGYAQAECRPRVGRS